MIKCEYGHTLSDYYPNGIDGNGIFTDLQALDVPWVDMDIQAYLNRVYYAQSGNKFAASLLAKREMPLTSFDRDIVARSVYIMYVAQWRRLYAVMSAEYDPIANYDMSEQETHSRQATGSTTDNGTTTETGTRAYTESGTVRDDGTTAATNSIWGFNSTSAVDSDKTSGTQANTETRNLSRSESPNISTSTENERESEDSETGTRTLTRRGNIGVTTSQQLLESEVNFWQWKFFEQVFRDIDHVLTLSVY